MVKVSEFDNFGVEDMSEDEFHAKEKYVAENCKCAGCPTYVEGDSPTGYCYPPIGTSANIKYEKDCICSSCSIYAEYELTHSFYCTRCSQVCQALKTEVGGGHE